MRRPKPDRFVHWKKVDTPTCDLVANSVLPHTKGEVAIAFYRSAQDGQLAKRKQALDALIDAQAATLDAQVKTVGEQIAAAQAQVAPDAASPKVTTVKGAAHLAKEQALLDAQNAAEQARLAKVAEFEAAEAKKRKAAMAKTNRERKAQAAASVKDFAQLDALMVS